jgi:hypothetical protein
VVAECFGLLEGEGFLLRNANFATTNIATSRMAGIRMSIGVDPLMRVTEPGQRSCPTRKFVSSGPDVYEKCTHLSGGCPFPG